MKGKTVLSTPLPPACDRIEQMQDMMKSLHASGVTHEAAYVSLMIGNCLLLRGDKEGAERYWRQSVQWFVSAGNRKRAGEALFFLGALACLLGRYNDAARWLSQALTEHRRAENKTGEADTLLFMCVASLARGEHQLALALGQSAFSIYRKIADNYCAALSNYAVGVCYVASGDYHGAIGPLSEAAEICSRLSAQDEERYILRAISAITARDASIAWREESPPSTHVSAGRELSSAARQYLCQSLWRVVGELLHQHYLMDSEEKDAQTDRPDDNSNGHGFAWKKTGARGEAPAGRARV